MASYLPPAMLPPNIKAEPKIIQDLLAKWSAVEQHLYGSRPLGEKQKRADNFILSLILFSELENVGFDFNDNHGLSLHNPASLTFIIDHHAVLQAKWYQEKDTMRSVLLTNMQQAGVSERLAKLSDPAIQNALVTVEDLHLVNENRLDTSKYGHARRSLRSLMAQLSRRIWQSISSSRYPLPGRWIAEDPSRGAVAPTQAPHLDIPTRPYSNPWLSGLLALKYDGLSGFKCADGKELRHSRSTGGPRLIREYELHRYFTSIGYRKDRPKEWEFQPDTQHIIGERSNAMITASTTGSKPCAMVVDGFEIGTAGTLTSRHGPQQTIDGQDQFRPYIQLHALSQFPSVDLFFGPDHIARITPEDCDFFDSRVLPTTHIEDDVDDDWLPQELHHQWPGLEFVRKSKEEDDPSWPTYVGEIIVTLKRGVELPLKTTATANSSLPSTAQLSVIQRVRTARHIRLAFVARDSHERACFEWFRIILSGSKSIVNDGLWANGESSSSLWAYMMNDSSESRSLDSLISNVVEGVKKSDRPDFPVVPVFLIDKERGTINHLGLPDQGIQCSSLKHLTASLILGAARAMQHQHLMHDMINRNTHSATFSYTVHSEFTTITADISFCTQLPFNELPDIGEQVLLSVLCGNNWSLDFFAVVIPTAVGSQVSVNFTLLNSDQTWDVVTQLVAVSNPRLNVRLELPLLSRFRAIEEIQQLATLAASSPTTQAKLNKFSIALRLTGDGNDNFTVPGCVVDKLNSLKSEVISCLRIGLRSKQQEAFDKSLDRVPAGYLNIQGPPGTGKSVVGIRIALAVASTQPVLIVAESNEVVSQIESALITQYKSLLQACPEAVDVFRMTRLYPRNYVRNEPRLSLLHQAPPMRDGGQSISETLWGRETQGHDLTLDHLVYRFAHHIEEDESTYSDALVRLSEEYRQKMHDARQSQHKGDPEKLASLDKSNNGLGAHLLSMMNVVVATIDTAALQLEAYHPRCLIFDEAAATLVQKGVSLIKKLDPAMVITIGDVQQAGPVVPSALASFNEFGPLLQRSLVEHLHPSERQTVTLDINFRNPQSCWEFSRRIYLESAKTDVRTIVDVTLQPRYSDVVHASQQPGFFNDCLRRVDLTNNQQIFVNVSQGHCERISQEPFDQAFHAQGYAPSYKTSHGTGRFRSADRTLLRNRAVHDAVEEMIGDLLALPSITKDDVLVQCFSRLEKEDLEKRLGAQAKAVNLLSTTSARGKEYPIVVTVINACNCSHTHQDTLPGDPMLNVALTRAQTFHFIVGNCDCIGRISSEAAKRKSLLKLVDYVNYNSHRVNFWSFRAAPRDRFDSPMGRLPDFGFRPDGHREDRRPFRDLEMRPPPPARSSRDHGSFFRDLESRPPPPPAWGGESYEEGGNGTSNVAVPEFGSLASILGQKRPATHQGSADKGGK